MSIPLRRCSGKIANHLLLQELPILPFLAPRVFTPWPKSFTNRRAQGTSQTIRGTRGAETNSHDVTWPGVKIVNGGARLSASEPGQIWSVDSGQDVAEENSTASQNDGQTPSKSGFQRRELRHRRQPRKQLERRSGWAVDNETFRSAYDEIWSTPIAEQLIQTALPAAQPESPLWQENAEKYTAGQSHASSKAFETPIRSQDFWETMQDQHSAKAKGYIRRENLTETHSLGREDTGSIKAATVWAKQGPTEVLPHDVGVSVGKGLAPKTFSGQSKAKLNNINQYFGRHQTSKTAPKSKASRELRYGGDRVLVSATRARNKDLQQDLRARERWILYRRRQSFANRLHPPVRTRYIRLVCDEHGQLNPLNLSWTSTIIKLSLRYDRQLGGRRLRFDRHWLIRARPDGFQHYANDLIHLCGASFQAKWSSLTEQQRQEQWSDIMLIALEHYPSSALQFLVATCKRPLPPSFAVSDSLELITKYWLQPKFSLSFRKRNAGILLRTIVALQGHVGGHYLELTQNTIFLLLLHLNEEQAEEFYRALTASGNPLHENTLLQFIKCLSRSRRTDCAVEVLRRLHLEGTDFTKPKVESICAALLSQKPRKADTSVSDSQLFAMMLECGLRPNIIFYNILVQNAAEAGDPETSWSIHDIMVENGIHPDAHTYSILLKDAKSRMDRDTIKKIFDVVKSQKIVNAHIATDMLHAVFLLSEAPAKETGARISPSSFQRMLPLYCDYFDIKPLMDIAALPMDQCQKFIPSQGRPIHPPKMTLIVMIIALLRGYTDSRSAAQFYDHFQALLREGHPDVLQLVECSQVYDAIIMALGSHHKTLHLCTTVVANMITSNLGPIEQSLPPADSKLVPVTRSDSFPRENSYGQLSEEDEQHRARHSAPRENIGPSSVLIPWSPLPRNMAADDDTFSASSNSLKWPKASKIQSADVHDSQASSSLVKLPALAPQQQSARFPLTTQQSQAVSPKNTPHSCPPTVWTWSVLLKAFVYNSQPHAAEEVLAMMIARGITPNIVTWNTLASCYARLQDVAATVDVIERFEKEGWSVNDVTLLILERIRDRQALKARLGEKEKRFAVEAKLREVEKSVEEAVNMAEELTKLEAEQQSRLKPDWLTGEVPLDEAPILMALAEISGQSEVVAKGIANDAANGVHIAEGSRNNAVDCTFMVESA